MGLQKMKYKSTRQRKLTVTESDQLGNPGNTPHYTASAKSMTTITITNTPSGSTFTTALGSGGGGSGVREGTVCSPSDKHKFSAIKTIKMKRCTIKPLSHHVLDKVDNSGGSGSSAATGGILIVGADEHEKLADLANIKSTKSLHSGLKGVSLKAIGVTFASIFKPTKRMAERVTTNKSSPVVVVPNAKNISSNAAKAASQSATNIIIDKSGVYIPKLNGADIQISFQKMSTSTKAKNNDFETPKSQVLKKMNSMGAAMVAHTSKTPIACMKSATNLTNDCLSQQLGAHLTAETVAMSSKNGTMRRKTQPSMGVMAYALKSRRNIRDSIEMNENLTAAVAANVDAKQLIDDVLVYESLANYHSNELYDMARWTSNKMSPSLPHEPEHDATLLYQPSTPSKLVPFLDAQVAQQTMPPGILSSTSRFSIESPADIFGITSASTLTTPMTTPSLSSISSGSSTNRLDLSPVEFDSCKPRNYRHHDRAKKMKSFSQVELLQQNTNSPINHQLVHNNEKVFYTYC